MKVTCSHGFTYEVEVTHIPQFGISTAYYQGRRIADRATAELHEPWGDSDRDWEEYQERLGEWQDAAESDLTIDCKAYFDQNR